jgi:hypothetical protein
MMTYQPQHIVSPEGVPLVVITKDEFDRLRALDGDEDAIDLALARAALRDDTRYPADVMDRILDGDSPIAAWRKHRT